MQATTNEKDIVGFLTQTIAEMTGNPALSETLTAENELADHGVDSVQFVNLIIQAERQFGIFFEDDELLVEQFRTIGLFARRILHKLGQ